MRGDGGPSARTPVGLPVLDPVAITIDHERAAAVAEVLESERARVARARDALATLAGPGSLELLESEARHLIRALRAKNARSLVARMASAIDRALETDREEILDSAAVPQRRRDAAMRRLEVVNRTVGAHRVWASELWSAIGDRRDLHIVEIASGTGGFMRELSERAHAGGRHDLRFTATDLRLEVLERWSGEDRRRGARVASRETSGARLALERRDATALGDIAGIDLFVCTQAAHHLGHGRVVAMIAQAARAPLGFLLIDVHRGPFLAIGAAILTGLIGRDSIVVRDGITSVRRGYLPSELALLAGIAGVRINRVGSRGPAYCVLHAIT